MGSNTNNIKLNIALSNNCDEVNSVAQSAAKGGGSAKKVNGKTKNSKKQKKNGNNENTVTAKLKSHDLDDKS
jgi:hypothetical protein